MLVKQKKWRIEECLWFYKLFVNMKNVCEFKKSPRIQKSTLELNNFHEFKQIIHNLSKSSLFRKMFAN